MNEGQKEKVAEIATTILEDYREENEAFETKEESSLSQALSKINDEQDVALYLTLTTALNYQRDADSHYERFGEAINTEKEWIFDPQKVIEEKDHEELYEELNDIGIRYKNKDTEIWHEICHSLYDEFQSNPVRLLEENDYDAEKIERYVQEADGETLFFSNRYPYLRGEKIRPLWIRFMNNSIHPLENFDEPDIPVDVHIIGVTEKLTGNDYTESESDKEEIRQFWRSVCEEADIRPVEIDAPLWFINAKWDSWGENYLQSVMSSVGYEP